MKLPVLVAVFFVFSGMGGNAGACAQGQDRALETPLRERLSVGDFCLCRTSVAYLKALSNDFAEVDVEEMDISRNCSGIDARFVNGKGFYSKRYPGMIFQEMEAGSGLISKIRLTGKYKGNLPGGAKVDVGRLRLKDVFNLYPSLKEKWGSRDCSDYWSFANDTLVFFVKIDEGRKPRFPIDKAYYLNQRVTGIDFVVSCDRVNNRSSDPVFFVDSVRTYPNVFTTIDPRDIATIDVTRDSAAVRFAGPDGVNGVVFITTKQFARGKYRGLLASRSAAYIKAVPSPEYDSTVVYILNGRVLAQDIDSTLFAIKAGVLKSVQVIDAATLSREYGLAGKRVGIVIKTTTADKK